MKPSLRVILAALLCLALPRPSVAEPAAAPDDSSVFALGLKIGTLGAGAEATFGFSDYISLRGGVNYIDYSYDDEIDDIDYDLSLDYFSLAGMVDLHPFGGAFRISVGIVKNENDLALDATPSDDVTIGNTTYSDAVTLTGDVDVEDVAPYVGIGFGNAARSRGNWSVTLDIGVIIQSYDVTLTADGPATSLPGFDDDLKREEQDIEDELNDVEIYPVLAIGIARRF